MVAITPMTELNAVNLILRNMGETPVNSLSGVLPLEASQAHETLIEVSEDVQTRGWYFNTETYRLSPDNNGFIKLPPSTLSVQSVGASRSIRVTKRSGRLYRLDPFNTGFTFEGPMELQLVLGLEFDDLPASARRYVSLRAARVAQVREAGDEMSYQDDGQDETRAWAELFAEQLAHEKLSLKESDTVMDVISGHPTSAWRLT